MHERNAEVKIERAPRVKENAQAQTGAKQRKSMRAEVERRLKQGSAESKEEANGEVEWSMSPKLVF